VKLLIRIVVVLLVVCIVLPVLALFALHFRPHAGRLDDTVEVAKPPAKVWAWMSEPAKVTKWVGWLKAIESDPASPAGVGHREVWVMGDPHAAKEMRIPAEYTGWEPLRSMAGRIRMGGTFDGEFTYTLEDLGGRTRVRQVSDWRYAGISWLLEPLITPEAQKKVVQDLGRMKQLCEADTSAAS
jgi:uncharacterized protein YndB with AHSA1/START domain